MRKRTRARECALKILYGIDITGDSAEASLDNFWQSQEIEDSGVQEFANDLVKGVLENLDKIDKEIAKSAANWQLKRMAVIDRNILRIATFELLFAQDIPPKVSINEAVDLAKRFGDVDSGRFVNGILDKINKTFCQDKQSK
ncbi:MAG: transcription antitermination factor NusB [Candidatus Omnitrophica bacterium]|nr:transcription antitermination factor NusB [Candidatus Omnitrophota bacterium]HOX54496.1 transcription antitermination factor NusB [Candidatus Omnitrophota bacterium]